MCGIFFLKFLTNKKFKDEIINNNFQKIKHRGPDKTLHYQEENAFIGFHRLAINGLSEQGDQPFIYDKENGQKVYVICNGEIYNYKELNEKYELGLTDDDSDCAVIYPLYEKFGLKKMINKLDGVFAFVIYDTETEIVYAGRDPIGVRPLFFGIDSNQIGFCSEAKGLIDLMQVNPFPPGSYFSSNDKEIKTFFKINEWKNKSPNHYLSLFKDNDIYNTINKVFTNAVHKRMLSDRPIGCLLSGGLDSSLVAAIVQKELNEQNKYLNTYSIGFKGSPDLKAARIVADYIGSNHNEVILDMKEIEARLAEIIMQLETWDTTTIRASVGMFFVAEYIHKNSDDVVIFSGEGSDELCQGYLYFHRQPNDIAGQNESMRLMNNLYMYDVLRADRTTAAHGLELRVPFLDKEFMKLITSLPRSKVCPRKGIEKYLLRKSFDGTGLLPDEILWRTKEAFSDGVSSEKNNWLDKIKTLANMRISDETFESEVKLIHHSPPRTKEELYYRKIFNAFYSDCDNWISDYWMPKWSGETIDPSARTLTLYSEKMNGVTEVTVESVA